MASASNLRVRGPSSMTGMVPACTHLRRQDSLTWSFFAKAGRVKRSFILMAPQACMGSLPVASVQLLEFGRRFRCLSGRTAEFTGHDSTAYTVDFAWRAKEPFNHLVRASDPERCIV